MLQTGKLYILSFSNTQYIGRNRTCDYRDITIEKKLTHPNVYKCIKKIKKGYLFSPRVEFYPCYFELDYNNGKLTLNYLFTRPMDYLQEYYYYFSECQYKYTILSDVHFELLREKVHLLLLMNRKRFYYADIVRKIAEYLV